MEYLKWLPLLPYIAQHPKLEAAVANNLPELQQAFAELQPIAGQLQGWLTKHTKLIALIEAEAPEAVALNNELAPIIKQLGG